MANNRNLRLERTPIVPSGKSKSIEFIGFRTDQTPAWNTSTKLYTPDGDGSVDHNAIWRYNLKYRLADSTADLYNARQAGDVVKEDEYIVKEYPLIGFALRTILNNISVVTVAGIPHSVRYYAVQGATIINGVKTGYNNIGGSYFVVEGVPAQTLTERENAGYFPDFDAGSEGGWGLRLTFAWFKHPTRESSSRLLVAQTVGSGLTLYALNYTSLIFGSNVTTSQGYYDYLVGVSEGYGDPTTPDEGGNGIPDDTSDDNDYPDDTVPDELDGLLANNGMFSVYRITPVQLGLLADYLFDENIFATFSKMWASPMEYLINARIFPFAVTGASSPITFGGTDTGVTGLKVSNFYKTIDCGSVDLMEYFGNFLDYEKTHVKIYLPFVGFRDLPIDYIMNGSIGVQYKVDLLTGAFACFVKATNGHGIIAVFDGTMAYNMPISQSNNTGLAQALGGMSIASVGGLVGGMGSVALYGGATALMGANKKDVSYNGSFSSNMGFLGNMTPYIVIERPISALPADYLHLNGAIASTTKTLGELSGFNVIKSIDFNHTEASADELEEIERILKEGVNF